MFGLGFWEIAIILAVALLVLGPSKLPELAKGLGKGLREFRKATEEFKSTIDQELYRPDPKPEIPAQIVQPQHLSAPVIATQPAVEGAPVTQPQPAPAP